MINHALLLVLCVTIIAVVLYENKKDHKCKKIFCNFKCIGLYLVALLLYLSESEDLLLQLFDIDWTPSPISFEDFYFNSSQTLTYGNFTFSNISDPLSPISLKSPSKGTLKIITVTSPRRAHPNINIINLTIHALYQFYPYLEEYQHVISLDGCPEGQSFYWESAWCGTYRDFYENLKEEISHHAYFKNVQILTPSNWTHRYGLGGTIKRAFDHFVQENDIVFIQQADFMITYKEMDWKKIVSEMIRVDELEYIRLKLDCVHEPNMWEFLWEKHHNLLPDVDLDLWQTCNWADHSHFVKPRVYYTIFDKLQEKGTLYEGYNAPETVFDHTREYCLANETRRHFFYGAPGDIVSHLDGSYWDPKKRHNGQWRATERVKKIVNGEVDPFA